MTEKKMALVTGAAGGLGRAIAEQLAARDYDLALLDIDETALAPVVGAARKLGAAALPLQVDLTDLDQAHEAVDRAVEHFGRLDLLVNNAAWREATPMEDITPESWRRTIDVCLTAPAFLSRWAAAAMRNGGVIINVSSMMAERGGGVSPAYVAAKGGLNSLTYELAALYGSAGVRVVAIAPGAIETIMGGDYEDTSGESLTDEMRRWSDDHIPLGRWARPEEIARAVAAIASDDFSYLHGVTITVDGGWSHTHFPHSLRNRMRQGAPPDA